MQLLLFTVSGLHYALPLAAVEKVFPAAEVKPLPGAPQIVEGFISLAGRIVPIFDIRSRFNLGQKPTALTDRIILANAGKRKVGIVADSVGEVLDTDDIIDAEIVHPDLLQFKGVVKIAGDMALIQDLDSFLFPEENKALDEALGTG